MRTSESRLGSPDHGRAPLDLFVEALERVRRVQPATMLAREVHVGEDVLGGIFEQIGHLGELRSQHVGHILEMGERGSVIGLSEDGAHDRCDGLLSGLGHHRQQVSHEMHSTSADFLRPRSTSTRNLTFQSSVES
jgi:hypothetical protein